MLNNDELIACVIQHIVCIQVCPLCYKFRHRQRKPTFAIQQIVAICFSYS